MLIIIRKQWQYKIINFPYFNLSSCNIRCNMSSLCGVGILCCTFLAAYNQIDILFIYFIVFCRTLSISTDTSNRAKGARKDEIEDLLHLCFHWKPILEVIKKILLKSVENSSKKLTEIMGKSQAQMILNRLCQMSLLVSLKLLNYH